MKNHNQPFARLFYLDSRTIVHMMRQLPNFEGSLAVTKRNKRIIIGRKHSIEAKQQIRLFHQDDNEMKIHFVFRPFKDVEEHHGFILITDAKLADEFLKLKDHDTRKYKLTVWENCDITVNEEMLAPPNAVVYHLAIRHVSNLIHQIGSPENFSSVSIREQFTKEDRAKELNGIYKLRTAQLSPLPELFLEQRWIFKHYGYCSILESVDCTNVILQNQNPRIRQLKVNLMNGVLVSIFRLVDLQFFTQFRKRPFSNNPSSDNTNPTPRPRLAYALDEAWKKVSDQQNLIKENASSYSSTQILRSSNNNAEFIDSTSSSQKSVKKMITKLSGEKFSVSFVQGQKCLKIIRKSNTEIANVKFARKILKILEKGSYTPLVKVKKMLNEKQVQQPPQKENLPEQNQKLTRRQKKMMGTEKWNKILQNQQNEEQQPNTNDPAPSKSQKLKKGKNKTKNTVKNSDKIPKDPWQTPPNPFQDEFEMPTHEPWDNSDVEMTDIFISRTSELRQSRHKDKCKSKADKLAKKAIMRSRKRKTEAENEDLETTIEVQSPPETSRPKKKSKKIKRNSNPEIETEETNISAETVPNIIKEPTNENWVEVAPSIFIREEVNLVS